MSDEIKYEHTPFDYLDYYKCNVQEGVTNQWRLGYGMEFFNRENNPMRWESVDTYLTKRIGLVVACSNSRIVTDFLLSSRLEMQIDCMPYVNLPLVAFRDVEMAKLEEFSKQTTESWGDFGGERILSSSIELERPIPLVRQQPWYIRVLNIPTEIEKEIKLEERCVSYERAKRGENASSSWYFYCGVRVIGDKVRPVI